MKLGSSGQLQPYLGGGFGVTCYCKMDTSNWIEILDETVCISQS